MIGTFLITIIIEGAVVLGYSLWKKKPVRPILFTSICGNLVTQSLLWIGLNLFFRSYLVALLIAEILIWILESIFLYSSSPQSSEAHRSHHFKPGDERVEVLGWDGSYPYDPSSLTLPL